jgi:hypothetical protein
MAASKQDRSDFEQGLKDRDRGPVQTVVDDVIVTTRIPRLITKGGMANDLTKTRTKTQAAKTINVD